MRVERPAGSGNDTQTCKSISSGRGTADHLQQ